jgi:hypothetical protein
LEKSRARFGILAAHDAENRIALRGSSAFIDYWNGLSVALMDRAGPREHASKFQSIELRIAVMTLVDHDSNYGFALPFRRERIELARAAIGTIAVREVPAFQLPFSHHRLPWTFQRKSL